MTGKRERNNRRLAYSGGRSPVDRAAWATADEFRDATRSVRAIELLDCPRSLGLFSSSGSLAMLAAMRPGFVAGATSLSVCRALR